MFCYSNWSYSVIINTNTEISMLPYYSQLDSLVTKLDCILQRSLTKHSSRVNILCNYFFNHLCTSMPVKSMYSMPLMVKYYKYRSKWFRQCIYFQLTGKTSISQLITTTMSAIKQWVVGRTGAMKGWTQCPMIVWRGDNQVKILGKWYLSCLGMG